MQRRAGVTFLLVTHDQEEALSMSDHLAVMNEGRIEQVGPPEDVYLRPRSRFVAGFLGAINWISGAGIRPEAVRLLVGQALPPAKVFDVDPGGAGASASMPLSFLGGRSFFDPLKPELVANVEVIVAAFGLRPEKARVGVCGDIEVFVVLAGEQAYLKQA